MTTFEKTKSGEVIYSKEDLKIAFKEASEVDQFINDLNTVLAMFSEDKLNFVPMELDEFKRLMLDKLPEVTYGAEDYDDSFDNYWDYLGLIVGKMDNNIEVDFENFGCGIGKRKYTCYDLEGFNRLDNGFCFLGCHAAGDWEVPVFFIIYWDGNEFRGYIPENGNVYNKDVNSAFGNNCDEWEIPGKPKKENLDYKFLEKIGLASNLPTKDEIWLDHVKDMYDRDAILQELSIRFS